MFLTNGGNLLRHHESGRLYFQKPNGDFLREVSNTEAEYLCQECLDLYPVPKVGEVVDFTYWQESEGIFGHLILKGQGEVVYVSHYDEPVFEDWCSHCGANHVVGTCDYYLDEA